MISAADMDYIQEQLKDVFQTKDECNNRHTETGKELNQINISIAQIATKMSMILKFDTFIATAAGGALLTGIFKLIIK